MKYIFFFLNVLFSTFSIGQNDAIDRVDTNTYYHLNNFKAINTLGRKSYTEKILLDFSFVEINNDVINNINEVFPKNTSTNHNYSESYDSKNKIISKKKAAQYVGFSVRDFEGNIFKNCYGLKSQILDSLQKFKPDDRIIVLGEIVGLHDGEEFGIFVKKIKNNNTDLNIAYLYTSEEVLAAISPDEPEVGSDISSEQNNILPYLLVLLTIIIISIKFFKPGSKK